MNICLFSNEEVKNGLSLNLKDERSEHLLKILHKKEGDSFIAGIVDGMAGTGTIKSISKEENKIYFDFKAENEGKPLNPLKMIIGFPRPIQLKRLLRDIAALGVCEVHLTGTELGEKSYMQSNLVERGSAYQMLLDGTVQAGSTHVPALFLHKTLTECIEAVKGDVLLCLDNISPASSLNSASAGAKGIVVAAIGSERGWTDKERKMLENAGYIRCGMGNRIMRTETAATVAGSIILNNLGFLDK